MESSRYTPVVTAFAGQLPDERLQLMNHYDTHNNFCRRADYTERDGNVLVLGRGVRWALPVDSMRGQTGPVNPNLWHCSFDSHILFHTLSFKSFWHCGSDSHGLLHEHAWSFNHKDLVKWACQAILTLGISIIMSGFVAEVDYRNVASATTVDSTNNEEPESPPIPKVFPPLKDLKAPNIKKVVLPNGLRVFLLEDHELGLVGGQILVKGGSKNDPVKKVGLAALTSIVQRSGGSTQHPAESLDVQLEEIAARIESSAGVSEMSVGFRCLSEDLQHVVDLFSEVVQNPLMPKDKLDLARTQLKGSIKSRGDNPKSIAAREFSKLLYGDKSAYARYFMEDTLSCITGEDLKAFHRDMFRPSASILGIWGDFDKEAVEELIRSKFSDWNAIPGIVKEQQIRSELEIGKSFQKPLIYLINKPGLNQGFVRMGELGTTIKDPDVFALDVLNDILNGFGGLLFDQVRSKEGLAYSVYGGWTPAAEHRGSFQAGGETQLKALPQFIGSVEKVLRSVTLQPPSEDDLSKAKEGIINSFVFNFVDSGVQLSRLMTYELFEIDQNFLFDYKTKVEGLTGNDIVKAARRHLHPGDQPIVVVTDASEAMPALQSLGKEVVLVQPEYLH